MTHRLRELAKKFRPSIPKRETPESFKSRRLSRFTKIKGGARVFGGGTIGTVSAGARGVSLGKEAIRKFREQRTIRQTEKRERQIAKEESEIERLERKIKLQELKKRKQSMSKKVKRRFPF